VDLTVTPLHVQNIIDLSAKGPYFTLEHGIGASPDKNTLVVTVLDSASIKVVGRKTGCVLESLDLNLLYGQTNEAVFSKTGDQVFVSDQANPLVYVLSGVPQHGLYLFGTESAPLQGIVDLQLVGGETGQNGLLLVSLTLGPVPGPKFSLALGTPFFILVDGLFNGDKALPIPSFSVPNDPLFKGMEFYFQGLTRDGDKEMRPSNLHTLKVL
jgi:hypothetical protein